MSISRAPHPQLTSTPLRNSANQRPSELEPYFRVETYELGGHGLVSIAREGLQSCTHAACVSNGLEFNTKGYTHRTNITEEAGQYNSTRGDLVSSFLHPDPPNITFQQHTDDLISKNISYAGFNELLLSPTFTADTKGVTRVSYDAAFVTNSGGGGRISVRKLTGAERQCGGISNGVDGHGADSWPKVKQGTKLLSDVLKLIGPRTTDAELSEHLFSILAWVFHSFSYPELIRHILTFSCLRKVGRVISTPMTAPS